MIAEGVANAGAQDVPVPYRCLGVNRGDLFEDGGVGGKELEAVRESF